VARFDGLPELYWVRIVGSTEMDAIGTVLTVYTSVDG
jgi:hypothetical protein